MDRLTKHFALGEFLCPCCNEAGPIQNLFDLAECLEEWRTLLSVDTLSGVPIKIKSGYRCPAHNLAVGGAKTSYHTLGMAADCQPQGVSLHYAVTQALHVEVFRNGGLGLYVAPGGGGWIHVDTRKENTARWGEFLLGPRHLKITFAKALEIAREIAQERGKVL